MALGKNIELFLMDGEPTGRWQVTLSNWNGLTYKIKRDDLKLCEDIEELHTPGVYFLFGRDEQTDQQAVYVGEGEDVLKRIPQAHTFDKSDWNWTEAVIFVTPGYLDKAKIKYLENRFHTIVVETGRFISKNGNTPRQSTLPKRIQDPLEEFILNTKIIMPTLGYKVFEPIVSTVKKPHVINNITFTFTFKGNKAFGKKTDNGFAILKGSYIAPNIANYVSPGIPKARKNYANIIDVNNILTQDIEFGSSSYAATFAAGINMNGYTIWKTEDGKMFKEVYKEK